MLNSSVMENFQFPDRSLMEEWEKEKWTAIVESINEFIEASKKMLHEINERFKEDDDNEAEEEIELENDEPEDSIEEQKFIRQDNPECGDIILNEESRDENFNTEILKKIDESTQIILEIKNSGVGDSAIRHCNPVKSFCNGICSAGKDLAESNSNILSTISLVSSHKNDKEICLKDSNLSTQSAGTGTDGQRSLKKSRIPRTKSYLEEKNHKTPSNTAKNQRTNSKELTYADLHKKLKKSSLSAKAGDSPQQ